MRKLLVVARREYLATVVTKGFVIGLVLMPVLMFSGILVPKLLKGRIDMKDKQFVVIDGTGELFPLLVKAAEDRNAKEIINQDTFEQDEAKYVILPGPTGPITDEVRLELSERIRKEELFAFIEIPSDLLTAPPGPPRDIPLHTQSATLGDERRWLDKTLNIAIQVQRLRRAGVDPAVVARAQFAVKTEGMSLYELADDGSVRPAEKTDRVLAIFIPMGVMMLMFMAMMTSQYMLQSTLEEKQQRIAEVLLGSLSPFQLMMGKLLANVGVSLTMVGMYLAGGYFLAHYHSVTHLVPLDVLGWFLIYQVLAVMLFGSIFGAVGAACSDMKDAQNLMMPVMLLIIFPLLIWFMILKEPNSGFAVGLSFVPTATPMLMILRMSLSTNVPWWQPALGVVTVLATTLVVVWAAGRVFRIGILSQGKAPSFRELLRWVVTG